MEDKPQEDDEDESISEEHHARKEQDEFANEEYFDNLIKKQNPKKNIPSEWQARHWK